MTDLPTLIARLEAAPEGSRELDALIHVHNRQDSGEWYADNDGKCTLYLPNIGKHVEAAPLYTRSLDAALLLTPYSGLVYWTIGRFAVQGELSIRTKIWPPGPAPGPNEGWHGKAATPALSFCAAALRARGETPSKSEEPQYSSQPNASLVAHTTTSET